MQWTLCKRPKFLWGVGIWLAYVIKAWSMFSQTVERSTKPQRGMNWCLPWQGDALIVPIGTAGIGSVESGVHFWRYFGYRMLAEPKQP